MGWTLFPKDKLDDLPEDAPIRVSYKASREWFYPVPTQTTTVRGRRAAKATAQAVREGGGHVVRVQAKRGWFW